MHFHLEIIMPPTDDVSAALSSILNPFSEDEDLRGEDGMGSPFWDWWQIGGRYSGSKYEASLDKDKLESFNQWLQEQNTTVSGVQFGKPELSPSSQIEVVDAKWNELFTPAGQRPVKCPFFSHSGKKMPMDICTLKEAPLRTPCYRCIVAVPSYAEGGWKLGNLPTADFMLVIKEWNGCNHMPVQFNGTIEDCLTEFSKILENRSAEFRQACTPSDDWLVVTVDYHS